MASQIRREEGQALVQVALALVLLAALMALVIDAGWIYADRRQAQNAADAAALAGARALCDRGASSARSAASDFADKNLDSDLSPDVDIDIDSYNSTVSVTVTLQRATILGRLLSGVSTESGPTAHAVAECAPGWEGRAGIMPIATRERSGGFVIGREYELREGQSYGNFGWLRWDGQNSSASTLCNNLEDPRSGEPLYVGDWVDGATGNMNSSCVRGNLDDMIDSGDPIIVLVFDDATGHGNNYSYHIAGFAEFVLTDYDLTGNDKAIYGRFNRWVTLPDGTDVDEASNGQPMLRLIQ